MTKRKFDYSYLPTPPLGQDTTQGQIFKRSLIGLNSEFSFSSTSCLTKAEEHSLPYYLPIAGGRIIGFIPFPRVLVLCEMQSVSSRIWARVAVYISYDDNHYTTGTSNSIIIKQTVHRRTWKYASFILSKQPGEINFEETIGILKINFRDRTSLFNAWWNCLNLLKCNDDDFVIYAGAVNGEWE